MDMDNGVGDDYGSGEWAEWRRMKGKIQKTVIQ